MKDIRIAAITCEAPAGEIDRNLTTTTEWTINAKRAGADLVCFPELNITGYCNKPEMSETALPIPGTVTDQLSRLAKDENIILLCGLAEHNEQGLPFAAHCVFTPSGEIQIYRKLHIAPPEKSTYSAGDRIDVFESKQICFGIQLCYDAHFPELSTAMTRKGAEVLFVPHASPRGSAEEKHISWLRHLTARAYDNSVFVVACNQIGANCNGLYFPGNAMVITPSGEVRAMDTQSRSSMLIADLKASELNDVRSHPMRHFFPNRRPDIYDR
jgi:N-carbamoylputrescine amidase